MLLYYFLVFFVPLIHCADILLLSVVLFSRSHVLCLCDILLFHHILYSCGVCSFNVIIFLFSKSLCRAIFFPFLPVVLVVCALVLLLSDGLIFYYFLMLLYYFLMYFVPLIHFADILFFFLLLLSPFIMLCFFVIFRFFNMFSILVKFCCFNVAVLTFSKWLWSLVLLFRLVVLVVCALVYYFLMF